MNRDIFISYSRKNYDAVIEIKSQIDAATETECWIDLNGVESGSEDFTDDIADGINNCKVFLFMLSEQSQESKWALGELRLAKKKNKHVVLVNIDGVEMNDKFFLLYSGTDIIAWKNHIQREKLIRDLCRWIGTTANQRQNATNVCSEPEYVDLILPSGTLWATCNVGANKPEEYGDYFAWGEIIPKNGKYIKDTYRFIKIVRNDSTLLARILNETSDWLTKYCSKSELGYEGFTDALTVLQTTDDAATTNWGDEWQMPTKEQWKELIQNTKSIWTTRNGVNGRLFTASNGKCLFFPAAGYRDSTRNYIGNTGLYWSSSLNPCHPISAWRLYFDSNNYFMHYNYRYCGQSVRPVLSSSAKFL